VILYFLKKFFCFYIKPLLAAHFLYIKLYLNPFYFKRHSSVHRKFKNTKFKKRKQDGKKETKKND